MLKLMHLCSVSDWVSCSPQSLANVDGANAGHRYEYRSCGAGQSALIMFGCWAVCCVWWQGIRCVYKTSQRCHNIHIL